MSKRVMLLCLLFAYVMGLCGCAASPVPPVEPSAHPETEAPAAVLSSPLTYLYFDERGSYFERIQGYEFRHEAGKGTAYFYMANEEELYPVSVDEAWVEALNGFVAKYDMVKWNGFSESASGLLDGTFFSTEFSLADGTQVRASGYGSFPAHYRNAYSDLKQHFLQLLPEDMRDW